MNLDTPPHVGETAGHDHEQKEDGAEAEAQGRADRAHSGAPAARSKGQDRRVGPGREGRPAFAVQLLGEQVSRRRRRRSSRPPSKIIPDACYFLLAFILSAGYSYVLSGSLHPFRMREHGEVTHV